MRLVRSQLRPDVSSPVRFASNRPAPRWPTVLHPSRTALPAAALNVLYKRRISHLHAHVKSPTTKDVVSRKVVLDQLISPPTNPRHIIVNQAEVVGYGQIQRLFVRIYRPFAKTSGVIDNGSRRWAATKCLAGRPPPPSFALDLACLEIDVDHLIAKVLDKPIPASNRHPPQKTGDSCFLLRVQRGTAHLGPWQRRRNRARKRNTNCCFRKLALSTVVELYTRVNKKYATRMPAFDRAELSGRRWLQPESRDLPPVLRSRHSGNRATS